MSIKGIKVKYAEFITSLSIFKGTIDTKFNMNSYWLQKGEMSVILAFLSQNLISTHH